MSSQLRGFVEAPLHPNSVRFGQVVSVGRSTAYSAACPTKGAKGQGPSTIGPMDLTRLPGRRKKTRLTQRRKKQLGESPRSPTLTGLSRRSGRKSAMAEEFVEVPGDPSTFDRTQAQPPSYSGRASHGLPQAPSCPGVGPSPPGHSFQAFERDDPAPASQGSSDRIRFADALMGSHVHAPPREQAGTGHWSIRFSLQGKRQGDVQ